MVRETREGGKAGGRGFKGREEGALEEPRAQPTHGRRVFWCVVVRFGAFLVCRVSGMERVEWCSGRGGRGFWAGQGYVPRWAARHLEMDLFVTDLRSVWFLPEFAWQFPESALFSACDGSRDALGRHIMLEAIRRFSSSPQLSRISPLPLTSPNRILSTRPAVSLASVPSFQTRRCSPTLAASDWPDGTWCHFERKTNQ